MGIGKRIKEARKAKGMTQTELANELNITKGAIANYENETSHPKEEILYNLFNILDVEPNYIFQDIIKLPNKNNDITLSEYEFIKDYRLLNDEGQEKLKEMLMVMIKSNLYIKNNINIMVGV